PNKESILSRVSNKIKGSFKRNKANIGNQLNEPLPESEKINLDEINAVEKSIENNEFKENIKLSPQQIKEKENKIIQLLEKLKKLDR
ncbi:MAG: hypothetical protein KAQ92_00955, partial [Candidatus Aenigmarchaeota archaeon]|nr:hypothetical protein [Candidatus Aenigmarchaeota archaeon]